MLRARETLSQAVHLAEPGRFLRPFVDLGPDLHPLLMLMSPSEGLAAYVDQIIVACSASGSTENRDQAAPGPPPTARPTHPDLIESLTNRELDVLMRLDERLANKEIARELGISSETVKQHTINLYRKLHVHSRRQAANAARAMGIL